MKHPEFAKEIVIRDVCPRTDKPLKEECRLISDEKRKKVYLVECLACMHGSLVFRFARILAQYSNLKRSRFNPLELQNFSLVFEDSLRDILSINSSFVKLLRHHPILKKRIEAINVEIKKEIKGKKRAKDILNSIGIA